MKFLFDFLPVLLFFVAFKFGGIYIATTTAIVATFAQFGWLWRKYRKIEPMQWANLVIILLFGGATLLLHDEAFIKWKPTALYWLFASTLCVAPIFGKNPMRLIMAQQIALPENIWRTLNLSWALFFAAMGGLNLLIAYHCSTGIWVNFKLFGGFGLILAFILFQSLWLAKYIK